MGYIQRLPEDYVQSELKSSSSQLEKSIQGRLKKVHSFLYPERSSDNDNREWIAYLAVSGKVEWSNFYRGTSLEDIQFYDHFARQQVAKSGC